jgi:hypothetical protein
MAGLGLAHGSASTNSDKRLNGIELSQDSRVSKAFATAALSNSQHRCGREEF